MIRLIPLGMLVCLAACSAPQGKKLAMNELLVPVASGPPSQTASLTLENRGEMINLYKNSTVTVTLPSYNRDGYEWRLSELPDPSVLRLVSREITPGPNISKPGSQKMVFQAVGAGDVSVKMWYGTLWASPMDEARPYEFVAAVSSEVPKAKPAAKSKTKKKTRKRSVTA